MGPSAGGGSPAPGSQSWTKNRHPQVGWANASLRRLEQLPALPEGATGLGVVFEDPLTAGMAPTVQAGLDARALDRLRAGD